MAKRWGPDAGIKHKPRLAHVDDMETMTDHQRACLLHKAIRERRRGRTLRARNFMYESHFGCIVHVSRRNCGRKPMNRRQRGKP